MKALWTSAAFLAATFATAASASTDGTLGPTSTGTFTVSMVVSSGPTANVQVFDLSDFSFNNLGGAPLDELTKNFCVIRDGGGGNVGLTISSFDAADTDFRMKTPGGSDAIQMSFTLQSFDVGFESVPLTEGTETVFPAPASCTPGGAGTRALDIAVLDAATAAVGNYSNSFLVTVSPK